MGNRGKEPALRGVRDRQRHALSPFYLILLLLLPSHSAQAPKIQRPPTTGPEMLAEAKRLAFLHNWPKAAPLFAQAEKFFAASGDHLGEIYAHVGRLRGEVESLSCPRCPTTWQLFCNRRTRSQIRSFAYSALSRRAISIFKSIPNPR